MGGESSFTGSTIAFSLVYLFGSVCISGGPAMTQWAKRHNSERLQLLGMIIFTFGGIFWNMGAMNMPALLVAPLLTSVLIMNVVFAKYVNHEKPTQYDVVGSCFLSAYMVLLVIGQPGDSKFHCEFITGSCGSMFSGLDDCVEHEAKFAWIVDEIILKPQFFLYLLMCSVSVGALASLNWHIRYHLAKRSAITGTDVDNYKLSFSCIGGVFGGSEDIFILFLNPLFQGAFAGCTSEFFSQWILYVDLVVVVLWFVFQMHWVTRGVVVAGAKLNGSLELISHQFATLFGIQIGLQGYKSFDDNMFGLPVPIAIMVFVVAIVCGVIGSAILMRGYSAHRTPARMYAISEHGSLSMLGRGRSLTAETSATATAEPSAKDETDASVTLNGPFPNASDDVEKVQLRERIKTLEAALENVQMRDRIKTLEEDATFGSERLKAMEQINTSLMERVMALEVSERSPSPVTENIPGDVPTGGLGTIGENVEPQTLRGAGSPQGSSPIVILSPTPREGTEGEPPAACLTVC